MTQAIDPLVVPLIPQSALPLGKFEILLGVVEVYSSNKSGTDLAEEILCCSLVLNEKVRFDVKRPFAPRIATNCIDLIKRIAEAVAKHMKAESHYFYEIKNGTVLEMPEKWNAKSLEEDHFMIFNQFLGHFLGPAFVERMMVA